MLIASKLTRDCPLVANALATGETVFLEKDDDAVLRRLFAAAAENVSDERVECYVVFDSLTALWIVQTSGIPADIHAKVDVFATTLSDLSAKTVFVKLPGGGCSFPALDRSPITRDSSSTVRLVIAGSGDMAEMLAVNAALVAHYPNYCRDHSLRTRITVVDEDALLLRDRLLQRYANLFDNSFYRSINLDAASPQFVLHVPMYSGSREDFVDVEWEFVCGTLRHEAVCRKLSEWAASPSMQLTVAVCHDDETRNVSDALSLPDALYANDVTILCHADKSELISLARNDARYRSVYLFGQSVCDISTMKTIKHLAKGVNHVYCHCFSLPNDVPVSAPVDMDRQAMDREWDEVGSLVKQYSNICNAMTLGTKMHSMGYDISDTAAFYAVSKSEMDIFSEVEHNRWSVEELILGYRPVNDEEQKAVEKDVSLKRQLRSRKIHYDLRAFSDLREDGTGKNVNVYDMVLIQGIPLIVKSCIIN